jgi:acetyl-CoA carboxylase biotin carboxylase subunit
MMGDKIQAKKIAKENGLPVIEGSEGGVKIFLKQKNFVKKLVFQF